MPHHRYPGLCRAPAAGSPGEAPRERFHVGEMGERSFRIGLPKLGSGSIGSAALARLPIAAYWEAEVCVPGHFMIGTVLMLFFGLPSMMRLL